MKRTLSLLTAGGLLLAAGCGTSGDTADFSPAEESSSPEAERLPDIDPPLDFGEPVTLPAPDRFHVHEGVLYALHPAATVDDDGFRRGTVLAVDMLTGATLGEAPLAEAINMPYLEGGSAFHLDFVSVGDEFLLLNAFPYLAPVTGSHDDPYRLRVRAFDPTDGSVAWTQDLESRDLGDPMYTFVAVDDTGGEHIAVSWGKERRESRSHLLEAATGESVWSTDDRTLVAAYGDSVAVFDEAGEEFTASVMDFGTETDSWSESFAEEVDAWSVGGRFAHFLSVDHHSYVTQNPNVIVDIAEGRVVAEFATGFGHGAPCHFDGESVIVCGDGTHTLFALDSTSGDVLWDLSTVGAGRTLPDVFNALRGGVLYMEYSDGARPAIALDARTGEDLVPALPGAFVEVGPGYGIELTEDVSGDPLLLIHPAIG